MLINRFPDLNALILDMDGVLWRADTPIGDLPGLFQKISVLGLKVVFATNNSTSTSQQYLEKLSKLGIPASKEQIVTSSIAAAGYLKKEFPRGGPVYVVGEDGLKEHLATAGFPHAEEKVLAVVVGLDRNFSYQKLRIANNLIRGGASFIGTNPDLTFPSPEGLTPGAGSMIAAIEAASGVKPYILGKPFPALFQQALMYLQTNPRDTLVVGDRLDTDILGGRNVGCPTALVLSGVTTRAEAESNLIQPDLIANSLSELLA